jgi:CRP-like cAMP-binding protein
MQYKETAAWGCREIVTVAAQAVSYRRTRSDGVTVAVIGPRFSSSHVAQRIRALLCPTKWVLSARSIGTTLGLRTKAPNGFGYLIAVRCLLLAAGTPVSPAMIEIADAKQNCLLAALSEGILERWLPDLEWVEMPLGAVLYDSGEIVDYIYFPTTSVVSLLYVMEDGTSAEIALVGNEGIVGIFSVMGDGSTIYRALVQSCGAGVRMAAKQFRSEFNRSTRVLHLMLHYTQALVAQMTQTAVCSRHHSLDQQLCRWLLLSLDRLHGGDLIMTQELIAKMLGVRREGVHEAASRLQVAGLIHYSRGHIKVLDRKELERRSCECYAAVKREYNRLLPDAPAQ